jgi:hypothetical protein
MKEPGRQVKETPTARAGYELPPGGSFGYIMGV